MPPAQANDLRRVRDGIPSQLFHYTDEAGLTGIRSSEELWPSLKALNPKDAFYGDGQYLSDIILVQERPVSYHMISCEYHFKARNSHIILKLMLMVCVYLKVAMVYS